MTSGSDYRYLFENMSEGFAVCEAIRNEYGELIDYFIVEINPALQKMLGVGSDVVGSKLSDSGNNTRAWLDLCDAVLRTGAPSHFEYENRQTGRWHDIRIMRLTDCRIAQFFYDVTERKIAEKRQRELIEEINHRVKNNLMMVSSVLRLQARNAGDGARDQLLKAVGRVQSISEAYRALYAGNQSGEVNCGTYLGRLCEGLAASLIDDADRISRKVDADQIDIPVDRAVPLGLWLVRTFVSDLGGNFALSSAPGGGTTAELWFPVLDNRPLPDQPPFPG